MSMRWSPLSRRATVSRPRRSSVSARLTQRRHGWAVLEALEDRTLMTGQDATTNIIWLKPPSGIKPYGGPGGGFTPQQVQTAYGLNSISVNGVVGDGSGQTIALVDLFDQPTVFNDLKTFDTFYKLPDPPSFTKVNAFGQASPLPVADAPGGWGGEEDLDVEWAHAVAPKANLILVEVDPADDLLAAVQTAAGLPGVSAVSMSFGVFIGGNNEGNPNEAQFDSDFKTPAGHTGVTFLAATGDSGTSASYPAFSPNVVAVGGTSLFLNGSGNYQSESGWSGSGGGVSLYEPKPGYQSSLPYSQRSAPDVSWLADPNTGVSIFDQYDAGGWGAVGGTSLACPMWAGLISIVNQERVAAGDPILDGPTQTLPMLYALPSTAFHDITTGNNGLPAGPGYDLVTGIGSPIPTVLVGAMTPLHVAVTPNPLTNVVVGTTLTNVEVATFTDKPTLFPASSYTATVDWGDGSPLDTSPAVSIVDLMNGTYGVFDSHVYKTVGTFTLNVNVTNPNAKSGVGSEPVTVSDAPLTPVGTTISGVVGQAVTASVGTFIEPNTFATTNDFTASITWGDGHVTKGTVSLQGTDPQGDNVFKVTGTNTYFNFGNFNVSTLVTSDGGSTATIKSLANISDAPVTPINRTFGGIEGTPVTVVVASFNSGNPRAVVANFSATVNWGDGTSTPATGVTILNRGTRFDVQATHTYAEFGTYPVTVLIQSAGGTSGTANTTATFSDAPLTGSASNIVSTIGQPVSGTVATFSDGNVLGSIADFAGSTIDWGDGTTTAATITQVSPGQYSVSGSHTYSQVNTVPTTITIVDTGSSTTTLIGQSTVVDAAILPQGFALTGVAGAPVSGTIATFIDGYALAVPSQFTASIDWGDGTVTLGKVSQPGGAGTTFVVTDGHPYAKAQSYPITVTISDPGGASNTASSSAVVSDAPIVASGVPIPPPVSEGSSFGGTIATFTTPNTLAAPTDFIAQIDWADGTTSAAAITSTSTAGMFNVSPASAHIFGPASNYVVTTTVISLGGMRATATTPVTVKDAPIVGVSGSPISPVAGTTYSGVVTTFSQYNLAPVSNFTATINWGDGHTSAGKVTQASNGNFIVSGSNLYTENGKYNVSVAVKSTGGSSATLSGSVVVADATMTSAPGTLGGVVGTPTTGAVATFHIADIFLPASEFTAAINWGDGSKLQAGAISGSAGTFTVTASHTYFTRSTGLPFSVLIFHVGPHGTGSGSVAIGSARILAQLTGSMSSSSDSGISNSDGITDVNKPVFSGKGEPGATVSIFAAPVGSPASQATVGIAHVDPFGNWAVQVNPLGDGSYRMTASMTDSLTGATVASIPLAVTPTGGPLVVSTAGPTVLATAFAPKLGQLTVAFHTGVGMNPVGLNNAANYQLAVPVGLGLAPFGAKSLKITQAAGGVVFVTVTYNLGAVKPGAYVLTLNSPALTDVAGNILVEKNFVTFPQLSNTPNPDYIAQFNVAKNLTASGPLPYISKAEQIAANNYANKAKGIRAAQVSASVPKPSKVGKKG